MFDRPENNHKFRRLSKNVNTVENAERFCISSIYSNRHYNCDLAEVQVTIF